MRWKEYTGDPNNPEKAYNYLLINGYTSEQASGIVGNMMKESTPLIDPDAADNNGAYGIVQWQGSRRDALEKFAEDNGRKVNDLYTQLDFVIHELGTTEKRAYRKLKNTSNPTDAANAFAKYYERPTNPNSPKRRAFAEDVLKKYRTSVPYFLNPNSPKVIEKKINPSDFYMTNMGKLEKAKAENAFVAEIST